MKEVADINLKDEQALFTLCVTMQEPSSTTEYRDS